MTQPFRIAIVGDGVLAAQAALTLAQLGGDRLHVTVVGTDASREGLGTVGPAVLATPDWLRSAAIAPHATEIVASTTGTCLSHGIAFDGWSRPGAAWFLPYGDMGAPLKGVPFHHLAAKARASGTTIRLGDYALAAMAAQSGRFAFPGDDPRSPLSTLDFGQHFPAEALARTFTRIATRCGARWVPARLRQVETEADGIIALALEDGTRILADLYLDCSGTDAMLIGALPGAAFEPRQSQPFQIVRRLTRLDAPPPSYALNRAHPEGWSFEIPLDGAIGAIDVYPGEAGPAGATVLWAGTRSAWTGNCVALGAAAAVTQPLFGIELLAAQTILEHLVRLLPASQGHATRTEFNRLSHAQATRLHDDTQALLVTNGRIGDAQWDAARAHAPSADLARRIDLFGSRGAVVEYDDELLEPNDWIMMLDGQGLRQRRIDPLAAAVSEDDIARHCTTLRARLTEALGTMPPLAATLAELRRART